MVSSHCFTASVHTASLMEALPRSKPQAWFEVEVESAVDGQKRANHPWLPCWLFAESRLQKQAKVEQQ
jgi:hypothetical protein